MCVALAKTLSNYCFTLRSRLLQFALANFSFTLLRATLSFGLCPHSTQNLAKAPVQSKIASFLHFVQSQRR